MRGNSRVFGAAILALALTACSTASPPAPSRALTLSWTDTNHGTAATLIERRAASEPFAPLATVPPGVTAYVDAGVIAGELYCYRARAVIGDEASEYSSEACR